MITAVTIIIATSNAEIVENCPFLPVKKRDI
jgi:hypothetical protein